MRLLPRSLLLRPRLLIALAALAVLALVLPHHWRLSTRLLVAWDVGALLYLGLIGATLLREGAAEIKARAVRQDEGALAVLVVACLAAAASVAAIGVQLAGLNTVPPGERWLHLALGGITILCSWTLLHAFFTLHYAGAYYTHGGGGPCLDFPGKDDPEYVDFLYFAYTIGCTSQTSDVAVTSRRMRGLVLVHSILAFVFNTSILALGINVGASLVSGGF